MQIHAHSNVHTHTLTTIAFHLHKYTNQNKDCVFYKALTQRLQLRKHSQKLLLPGMAHDKHTDLAVHWLQLLEGGYHKDSCLAHTTLSLTDDIHAQDSLRDALILDCGSEIKSSLIRKCKKKKEKKRGSGGTQHRKN